MPPARAAPAPTETTNPPAASSPRQEDAPTVRPYGPAPQRRAPGLKGCAANAPAAFAPSPRYSARLLVGRFVAFSRIRDFLLKWVGSYSRYRRYNTDTTG